MTVSAKLDHLIVVLVSAFTVLFCSIVFAEEAAQTPTAEQPKTTESASPVKATAPAQGNLTFLDDQQTWRNSEIDSYQQWMKNNPRYSHPMFQSQWNQQHGSNFVDDRPDPNYRPWSYRTPWYQRGAVSHVRGRTLWVNPRYPAGKYYGSNGSQPPTASETR